MYKELDVVRLKVDLPEQGLTIGEEGTIVLVHPDPLTYEVEFVEPDGSNKALAGLRPEQIELTSSSRP